MEKEEIRKIVLKALENTFHTSEMSEITDTDILRDRLVLDSFRFMALIISLSRKFSITFNPADIARMENIENIVTLVSEKQNQKLK